MDIYCVDFERIIAKFSPYIDGSSTIEEKNNKYYIEMETIKKEMESIVNASKSGLILDENIQRMNVNRFKELQQKAMFNENEFRNDFTKLQNDLMEECFNSISEIIEAYCKKCDIPMVVNKSHIVYVDSSHEITDYILNIIKEKGLLFEEEVEKTEEVEG
jgi:Skp family chaperone for outer membrane proteins